MDADCHPQTIAVLKTRAEPLGIALVIGAPETDLVAADVFGALFQYPGSSGALKDPRATIEALHAAGGIAVMAADPLALTVLTSPGELGRISPLAPRSVLACPWVWWPARGLYGHAGCVEAQHAGPSGRGVH